MIFGFFSLTRKVLRLSGAKDRFLTPGTRAVAMKIIIMTAALLPALMLIGSGTARAETEDLIRLGAVEDVVLLPWGVRLPARIDTGAAISSLDARDIKVENEIVEFKLAEQYGGTRIRLPLVRWMTVKTAAARTKRPVVMMELCIGSKRIWRQVNLNDRSRVEYPLLIGRNTIQRSFVVDCSSEYFAQPSCSGVAVK